MKAESGPLADGQEAAKAAGSIAIIKALDTERLEPSTNFTTNEPEVVWAHDDFARELKKAKRTGPRKMSDTDLLMFLHGASGYYRVRFCFELKPFFVELWQRIDKGEFKMSKTEACRQVGCSPQWANAIVSGRADERREQRGEAKEAKTRNLVSTKLEASDADWSDDQDDSEDWGDELQDGLSDERRESEESEEEAKTGGSVSAGKLASGADWSDDEDDLVDEHRGNREEVKGAKADSVSGSDDEKAGLLTREEYVHKISKTAFAILKPVMQRDWQLYHDVCEDLSKQFGEASKTPPVAKALTARAN